MSLSIEEVQRIARLARIRLDEDEIARIQAQLNGIFDFIAAMQAVDAADVVPMAHARDVYQRLRPDEVTETDRRDVYQAVAPHVENGLYLVPKVIE